MSWCSCTRCHHWPQPEMNICCQDHNIWLGKRDGEDVQCIQRQLASVSCYSRNHCDCCLRVTVVATVSNYVSFRHDENQYQKSSAFPPPHSLSWTKTMPSRSACATTGLLSKIISTVPRGYPSY